MSSKRSDESNKTQNEGKNQGYLFSSHHGYRDAANRSKSFGWILISVTPLIINTRSIWFLQPDGLLHPRLEFNSIYKEFLVLSRTLYGVAFTPGEND
jgi:hypothetical protein